MNRGAVLLGDDEIAVFVVSAPFVRSPSLPPTMRAKQVDRLVVQIDHPCVVALRRRLDDLVRHRDDGVTDREARCLEVDVGPTQAEDLAAAHAGHGGEPPDRLKPRSVDRLEEAGELVRFP